MPPAQEPPVSDLACPSPELLAALTREAIEPGAAQLPELSTLYTEFDTPDPDRINLAARTYLRAGFGAEATQILPPTLRETTDGRLITAIADLLEGRASNSRVLLSQTVSCPSPMPSLAALAGLRESTLRRHAPTIAASFVNLPSAVRMALGPDLFTLLIGQDLVDSARQVFESLSHDPHISATALASLEATLDRARGSTQRAQERLNATASPDIDATLLQLELALETDTPISTEHLADATTLAASLRTDPRGQSTAIAAIQLHLRDARPLEAFAEFDRLTLWLPETRFSRSVLHELRNELWDGVARKGSDDEFLAMILERADWRRGSLERNVAAALATRLNDLGLSMLARETGVSDEVSIDGHTRNAISDNTAPSPTAAAGSDMTSTATPIALDIDMNAMRQGESALNQSAALRERLEAILTTSASQQN